MPEMTVVVWPATSVRRLEAALQSVFDQTDRRFEVIVLHDGEEPLQLPNGRDGLAVKSTSEWKAAITGRYVAFLRGDDLWLPEKLARQTAYLDRFPDAGLVSARSLPSSDPIATAAVTGRVSFNLPAQAPSRFKPDDVRHRRDLAFSTIVVRRDVLKAIAGFPGRPPGATLAAGDLGAVASHYQLGYVDEPLAAHLEPQPARREHGRRAPSLVYDTVYWRVRRTVAAGLHAVDDALARAARGDHVRLLFEAASPMSVSVFRPVLNRLRLDNRVDLWFTTSDRSWSASQIFTDPEMHGRILRPAVARLMKFDAYVNTDFWNFTWLPRRVRRVHLFHGVAGKYGLDAPVRIAPVVASFDRLLFPNIDRLRRYQDAGLVTPGGIEAALVGYPKVDCLVDGSLDRAAIQHALGIDPRRPTVLYAPTWSPYSSLQSDGLAAIRGLAQLDVNVVVKLHDRSYERLTRGSGGVDWRREMERLGAEYGVHVGFEPDASPYLFVADALVTDHSSVGFEYMLLDRPVVVIDCPELIARARVTADKVRLLRSGSSVVEDGARTPAAVMRALEHPEGRSEQRRRIANELFYKAGTATERAVQCFYELLNLEAPAAGPARLDLDQMVLDGPCPAAPVPATIAANFRATRHTASQT